MGDADFKDHNFLVPVPRKMSIIGPEIAAPLLNQSAVVGFEPRFELIGIPVTAVVYRLVEALARVEPANPVTPQPGGHRLRRSHVAVSASAQWLATRAQIGALR